MKFIFYLSLLFILYTYAGYPALIYLLARFFPRRVKKGPLAPEPLVSVVVAARNEERFIGKKVESLLGQDYPPDRLEIVIVSDGSTDGTNAIVESFAAGSSATIAAGGAHHPRLRLIVLDANRGKPSALNAGVAGSHGEYIVFADARQEFGPRAVRELVSNFSDPAVGSVSGELLFREDSKTEIKSEMGLYWKIEKWIRRTEGAIHSVVGATGAIYAIRKSLFVPIPADTILDDVFVPMKIVCAGYRNVYDGEAVAYDRFSKNLAHEAQRKVRTLLGNYQLIRISPELLLPFGNPLFVQFFSHKVFRLFVPFLFIAMVVAALFLSGLIYRLALAAVVLGLLMCLFNKPFSRVPVLGSLTAIARTFLLLNSFAFIAFFRAIRPGKVNVWK
jgi:biofilm PGA synthesis N-glycosyltransferase PgaC